MWDLHNGFWDFALMFVIWALIAVLVCLAVWTLVDRPGGASQPRAEEVLDERYARGEISAEEYRERRKTLREAGTPA